MTFKIMNDYELVYLIQTQNDQIAFDYLYEKYRRFIWKCVHLLNIDQLEQEDFFQEGILILHKAVLTFDESKNKTFTRYFELILKRHYYYLISKLPKYQLYEDTSFLSWFSYDDPSDDFDLLEMFSDFEKCIYQYYFIEQQSVKRIAEHMKCQSKKIYNAIFRIKEKYKNMI